VAGLQHSGSKNNTRERFTLRLIMHDSHEDARPQTSIAERDTSVVDGISNNADHRSVCLWTTSHCRHAI
jgi:hypothetical protein